MKKELTFTKKDGKVIRGVVYLPDSLKEGEKCPTVIFSHGFGGNYRCLEHHGNGYAKAGIACVFFDFCGGGLESLSDGSMKEMTVLTEADDLEAVFDQVRSLEFADPEKLYLQGESMGGFVSAYVAAKKKDLVKGLILWYPAFVIPDDSRVRYEKGDDTCFDVDISPDFNRAAMNIDVFAVIPAYKGPVKIIHGDRDEIVPLEYSVRAVKVYDNAELVVINGAGHGYEGADSDKARRLSIDFIE